MSRPALRRPLLGGLLALFVSGAWVAAPAPSQAASFPSSSRLVTVMPAARAPGSRTAGPLDASARIDGAVGLLPRHRAALASLVSTLTKPGSPRFHHYLSEASFVRRFGPSSKDVHLLERYLERNGLHVTSVSPNRLLVGFSADAAEAEAAFHTRIDNVLLSGGARGRATTSPVTLPASIARHVGVVTGLDDLVHAQAEGYFRRTRRTSYRSARGQAPRPVPGAPRACPAATSAARDLGGLTDAEIASSYGAFGLYRQSDTGTQQHIAVFELEPFVRSDIATFDGCYFGPARATAMMKRLRVHAVDGGQPVGPGSGESVLDVENVSAMAPGARIDVYEAPNTNMGSLDEYNAVVSADADDVVTTSWGLCETAVHEGEPGMQQEENLIFEEAAAQGQTVFAAAGDTGSDDCDTFESPAPVPPVLSVDDPGSQPYVVSAGGTTVYNAVQPPVESVWNDGASGGAGGGGISNSWVMPSWQASATVPGIAPTSTISSAEGVERDRFCAGNADGSTFGGRSGEACREVPDISADADELTGAITGYSAFGGGWGTVGGTSSSAPIWAAMLALVDASPMCSSESVPFAGGGIDDVGFASPLLYRVASSPSAYGASFTDVRLGSNDAFGISGQRLFASTAGYDMASGLGSPQLTAPGGRDGLAYYMCTLGRSTAQPEVTGLVPDAIPASAGTTSLVVTGSGFSSGGPDGVGSVSVGNFLVPPADVTVDGPHHLTLSHLPPGSDLLPTGGKGDGAGAALVAVSLRDGATSAPTPPSRLEVVDTGPAGPLPAVSGVMSAAGPEHGGNAVTVFGSGFVGVASVTFGGARATDIRVRSDVELTAVVPAWRPATRCATRLSPATNVCQVDVVVTTSKGSSRKYPILPPYSGPVAFDVHGVVTAPAHCGCEVAPALNEYDYFPEPRISRVSTTGRSSYASESGGSTITVRGTGLGDLFGTIGAPIGPPSGYGSWDTVVTYDSPGELQLLTPPEGPSVQAISFPLRVVTAAGTSAQASITYAGFPETASIRPTAFPSTGGRRGTVRGVGLGDTLYLEFVNGQASLGTVYDLTRRAGSLGFVSPQGAPGRALVVACSVSGCGNAAPASRAWIYPPGNPSLSGLTPASGKAHGGAAVVIRGKNLSCASAVFFGRQRAKFHNASTSLPCGSLTTIIAVAPPGRAGRTVAVTVKTVESQAVGFGTTRRTRAAGFRYLPSSPSAPLRERVVPEPASLRIEWRSPAANGGARITSYVVRATARGLLSHVRVLKGRFRSWRLKDLYPGTTWTVSVTAHNRFGAGVTARRTARPLHRRKRRH